jgi:hypothetical protein
MPRPREYATDAERQRACRARLAQLTVRVDRDALDRLHARLDRLQTAIHAAAHSGDPTALACRAASTDTLLDRLASHFEAVASGTADPGGAGLSSSPAASRQPRR